MVNLWRCSVASKCLSIWLLLWSRVYLGHESRSSPHVSLYRYIAPLSTYFMKNTDLWSTTVVNNKLTIYWNWIICEILSNQKFSHVFKPLLWTIGCIFLQNFKSRLELQVWHFIIGLFLKIRRLVAKESINFWRHRISEEPSICIKIWTNNMINNIPTITLKQKV